MKVPCSGGPLRPPAFLVLSDRPPEGEIHEFPLRIGGVVQEPACTGGVNLPQ